MANEYKWTRLEPLVKDEDDLNNVVVDLVCGMTGTDGEYSAYIDTKIPYRAYLDLGKNLPTAQNSDELEAQLERISGMEDRTYLQQNYLAQKVYARYLMNQCGGARTLCPTSCTTPHESG